MCKTLSFTRTRQLFSTVALLDRTMNNKWDFPLLSVLTVFRGSVLEFNYSSTHRTPSSCCSSLQLPSDIWYLTTISRFMHSLLDPEYMFIIELNVSVLPILSFWVRYGLQISSKKLCVWKWLIWDHKCSYN